MKLRATRWKRYGRDRLYANPPDETGPDGRTLGREITVLRAEHRDDVITVLAQHLQNNVGPDPSDRASEAEAYPMRSPESKVMTCFPARLGVRSR